MGFLKLELFNYLAETGSVMKTAEQHTMSNNSVLYTINNYSDAQINCVFYPILASLKGLSQKTLNPSLSLISSTHEQHQQNNTVSTTEENDENKKNLCGNDKNRKKYFKKVKIAYPKSYLSP